MVRQAFCEPYGFIPSRSVGALVPLPYVGTVSGVAAGVGIPPGHPSFFTHPHGTVAKTGVPLAVHLIF